MSLASPWREHVRVALGNLGTHRLRSFLTTLGIIVGVMAVVSVVSITRSLEGRILADLGADQARVFGLSARTAEVEKGTIRFQRFDLQQIRELREQVPEIQALGRTGRLGAVLLRSGSREATEPTYAVDEHFFTFRNLEVSAGRVFTPTDRILQRPVVVVGHKLAQRLGIRPEQIGRTITLGGQTAELVGILEGSSGIKEYLTRLAFVPFGSFRSLARPSMLESPSWTLLMDASLSQAEAKEKVREALRRIRGLRATDPDNFTVRTNEQAAEQVGRSTSMLMAAAGGMVGISLLVGGIGVMNIMLVTVTERTREIGLRKAMGARRKDILTQFLIEAMVLCVLGGVLGLGLGILAGDLVGRIWIKFSGFVPWWALTGAFLVPATTGLVFGLYPARKAARLDPIEALRYE